MRTYARAEDEISRNSSLEYYHVVCIGRHAILSGEFFFSLRNLCVHMHVQKMKFNWNFSIGDRHVVCIREATMYKMKKSIDHVSNKFRGEISLARCWKNSSEACNGSSSACDLQVFFRSSFSCFPLASHVSSEREETNRKLNSDAKITNVEIY